MFRIRHYDRFIHPDYFRNGWLGRWIRALNWVRWKLETFNQRLVLKYLCREGSVDSVRAGELLQKFKTDVRDERVRKEMTSPLAPTVTAEEMTLAMDSSSVGTLLHQAMSRGVPTRPQPIDALANRYGAPERARRYARGKLHSVTNTEFESVDKGESES